jgi:hypothetical protein
MGERSCSSLVPGCRRAPPAAAAAGGADHAPAAPAATNPSADSHGGGGACAAAGPRGANPAADHRGDHQQASARNSCLRAAPPLADLRLRRARRRWLGGLRGIYDCTHLRRQFLFRVCTRRLRFRVGAPCHRSAAAASMSGHLTRNCSFTAWDGKKEGRIAPVRRRVNLLIRCC